GEGGGGGERGVWGGSRSVPTSRRSSPAQNAGSVPVSTMQRAAWQAATASTNSVAIVRFTALRAARRSRVISATPLSPASTRTHVEPPLIDGSRAELAWAGTSPPTLGSRHQRGSAVHRAAVPGVAERHRGRQHGDLVPNPIRRLPRPGGASAPRRPPVHELWRPVLRSSQRLRQLLRDRVRDGRG